MIIGVLCWFNGLLSIVRFYKFEDRFDKDADELILTVAFFLESLTFFCAIWLFGLQFFETVLDLETMISNDDSRD